METKLDSCLIFTNEQKKFQYFFLVKQEWFEVELANTLEKELGEEAAEVVKEPKYFVDFMRDAPEPTGEEVELI